MSRKGPIEKALDLNLDPGIYGTFAEIGAGQEVARHFFQAGLASQTVAKTISAYDMAFSDAIYGKHSRYVCQERVEKMLDHEYVLLEDRLDKDKSKTTRYFAFANTVATNSKTGSGHGWLGIRFQNAPEGPTNDIVIHVNLRDDLRLAQQECLGMLGVNLIHSAFFATKNRQDFIQGISEGIHHDRMDIDMICFSGPDMEHIDNRLISLDLVKNEITGATIINAQGQVLQPSDYLYGKNVLVHRGTFRPITQINLEIIEKGMVQLKKETSCEHDKCVPLLEITTHNLSDDGLIATEDFLQRIEAINACGYNVLISNFFLFYQLKGFLRSYTDGYLAMVIGASHLDKIFEPSYYTHIKGSILEALGKLFDPNSRMYVFPYKDDKTCNTTKSFFPKPELIHLYKHLLENKYITDIEDCDNLDTSVHSDTVREMLLKNEKGWETLVPKPVCELIKSKQLFGFQP